MGKDRWERKAGQKDRGQARESKGKRGGRQERKESRQDKRDREGKREHTDWFVSFFFHTLTLSGLFKAQIFWI